jgi:hypothetical protein
MPETFQEQMKRARVDARLKKDCNGREDCTSEHHLACCLSLRARERPA